MRILFTPQPLIECQKLYWLHLKGLFKLVNYDPDLVFNWQYPMTVFEPITNIWGVPVINENCLNVTKSYIDKVYSEIYGFSTAVHSGWAIEKPEYTNGMKDVRLVNLNETPKREGYFYQRFLTSGRIRETRLTIMNGRPVYRLDKIKWVTEMDIPGRVLQYEFMPVGKDKDVTAFCARLGLDYGELDIINGIIIDVNPTPGDAAFVRMKSGDSRKYLTDYCNLFKSNYYAKEDRESPEKISKESRPEREEGEGLHIWDAE